MTQNKWISKNEIDNRLNEIVKSYAELKNKKFPDLDTPCPVCGAPSLKQTDATYVTGAGTLFTQELRVGDSLLIGEEVFIDYTDGQDRSTLWF